MLVVLLGCLPCGLVQTLSCLANMLDRFWALHSVALHLGKTDGAEERLEKHVGTMLTPPFSPERALELPPWTSREVVVNGKSWDQSSVDISIAGVCHALIEPRARAVNSGTLPLHYIYQTSSS